MATKICPNEADNHISFHIKGVFGTHPNNTFLDDAEKGAKVKFVATGTNVWATFFDMAWEALLVDHEHFTDLRSAHLRLCNLLLQKLVLLLRCRRNTSGGFAI